VGTTEEGNEWYTTSALFRKLGTLEGGGSRATSEDGLPGQKARPLDLVPGGELHGRDQKAGAGPEGGAFQQPELQSARGPPGMKNGAGDEQDGGHGAATVGLS
jgi:hypothetical protein